MLFFIDRDRERLTAAVTLSFNEGHIESIRVLSELLGAGHAGCTGADDKNSFTLARRIAADAGSSTVESGG